MDEIVFQNAVSMFFALLQMAIVGALSGVVKIWWDVSQLKRDMNEAHRKIRSIETSK